MLQVSAKQSSALKIAGKLSKAAQLISKFEIDTPHDASQYVGLTKKDKVILFEMIHGDPASVWHRSTGEQSWTKSQFLGYPIIESYTLKEIQGKTQVLKDFVDSHWVRVSENPSLTHGDLTHLNVLLDGKKVSLIDEKEPSKNPLTDIFSLYAYLKQCFNDHESTGTEERKLALSAIDEIFYSALRANDKVISTTLLSDLQEQHFPGLRNEFQAQALSEFEAMLSR